jgi:hypothetical protein
MFGFGFHIFIWPDDFYPWLVRLGGWAQINIGREQSDSRKEGTNNFSECCSYVGL